ncbi:MAG TPA: energy transducer TonB [Crocinitomicaceae bacterium]|nr:energy transducer TonB [Crocinitomicaceae bacterium]
MKKLIYSLFCLFVTFATFAQADTTKYNEPSKQIEDSIFVVVDVLAEFPGGKEALFNFFADNINLPSIVVKDSLSGKSIMKFVIEIDGSFSNVAVIRRMEGCPECDAEVVRVMKMMPKWSPSKKNGKLVPSYFTAPFEFSYK